MFNVNKPRFRDWLMALAWLWAALPVVVLAPVALAETSAMQHAAKHLQPEYVCPMHPQVSRDEAGDCPICGMPLEPVQPAAGAASASVSVSAAMQHSFGVELVHVSRGPVAEEVYASGYVTRVAPAQTRDINSRVNAPIARRHVQGGQWVQQDEVLLTLDYPAYADTLKAYLDAMEQGAMQLALDLREQLAAMGVSDTVLAGFDEQQDLPDKLTIVAPIAGEIVWISDAETASQGERLVSIQAPALAEADLRSYSRLARGVGVGHRGRLHVAHLPGRSWQGKVVEVIHNRAGFFSSLLFQVEVPAGVLEPGAFANAYIDAGQRDQVLRVPASAVIYEQDSARVVRWLGGERFDVVEVEPGYAGHDWVEIRSGLAEGDHVVTRAQFLIDSEATLRAGLKRLGQPPVHQD